MENEVEKIIESLFPLLFIGVWVLITKVLSIASGWNKLANLYQYRNIFDGKLLRFQSANISGVGFNSSLEVGISARGLYLRPFILFRPFHAPLLIPWSHIKKERIKKYIFTGYRFKFPRVDKVNLNISEKLYSEISKYLP
jgi:hypothetical protein